MSLLRATLKIILMILWLFCTGIFGLFVCWGGWRTIRYMSKAAKLWSTGIAKIINLKIEHHGNVPEVSGIIISNHQSYIDIITTSSLFNIRLAPAVAIRKWPVLGLYFRLSRPIWVDRKSRQTAKKTMKEFIETIKHNINLLVFPEGKISDGSNGLQVFKSTTFEAAVLGDCSVVPILIHYRDKNVCWTKWKLSKHLWNVLKMKRIIVDVHFFDPIEANGMDRKSLARHVHDVMDKKYKELY
jgi:1-acyl-sn-glycerol-3-phosphate acyltransferase